MKNLLAIFTLILFAHGLIAQNDNKQQIKDQKSYDDIQIVKSVDKDGNEIIDTVVTWYIEEKPVSNPRTLIIQDDDTGNVDTILIYDLNKKEGERESMIIRSIDENGKEIIDTVKSIVPDPIHQEHPNRNKVNDKSPRK